MKVMFSLQARSNRREQAARITEQDDLEQQLGRVSRATHFFVGIKVLKPALLDALFDQMMERILQTARGQLLLQSQWHQQTLPVIVRLETRHGKAYLTPSPLFQAKNL